MASVSWRRACKAPFRALTMTARSVSAGRPSYAANHDSTSGHCHSGLRVEWLAGAGKLPGPRRPLTSCSTDWRERPVRSAISEAQTSSSGSTRMTRNASTLSTSRTAEMMAASSVGASRSNEAKVKLPLVENVASSQPASTRASRRSSVRSPLNRDLKVVIAHCWSPFRRCRDRICIDQLPCEGFAHEPVAKCQLN